MGKKVKHRDGEKPMMHSGRFIRLDFQNTVQSTLYAVYGVQGSDPIFQSGT